MAIIIQAYHTNRKGESVDLINANDGTVIFPFSNGSIIQFVFNSDENTLDRDTLSDENNTDGIKLTTFYKLNEWIVIGASVPEHMVNMLYMLKVLRNKYLIMNNKRIQFYDIIIDEAEKDKLVTGLTISILISETSITGNF